MLVNGLITMMLVLSAEKPSVNVLCYHAFRDDKNMYSFSISELRSQIGYFKSRGYTFVEYNDIISGKIQGRKNILVTVDDGNVTVYKAYLEVFKPEGIKPVIAIYPAVIGKEKYALSWAQAKELSDAGCTVAAHGYNHLYVNSKLHAKDFESFKREIYYSKKVLEERLGRRIEVFIYPFGDRSDVTKEHLQKAGYAHAFTIVHGQISIPVVTKDAYELPRYMITRPLWEKSFAAIDKKSGAAAAVSAAEKVKPERSAAADKKIEKPVEKKKPVITAAKEKKPDNQKTKSSVKTKDAGPVDIRDAAFGRGTAAKKDSAANASSVSEKKQGASLGLSEKGSDKKADASKKKDEDAGLISAAENKKEIAEKKDTADSDKTAGRDKPDLKPEHVAEIKKTYYRMAEGSHEKYGSFNERVNSKIKKSGSKVGKYFDLNRDKGKGK